MANRALLVQYADAPTSSPTRLHWPYTAEAAYRAATEPTLAAAIDDEDGGLQIPLEADGTTWRLEGEFRARRMQKG